ncbi:hypothetical protein MPNT_160017 [Candidatus Methylacidithermus pantelleriae]|uniref:Uncharacterized protein n=1 Tax=Candidatus Methylacidithermus pantelleriae TaxID=2744239 RepID=A0A8J2FS72_9BACT|nr:hypothetical protein MPNT_160017 [Candidatus Methylacidithermus pantelleriae]
MGKLEPPCSPQNELTNSRITHSLFPATTSSSHSLAPDRAYPTILRRFRYYHLREAVVSSTQEHEVEGPGIKPATGLRDQNTKETSSSATASKELQSL